MKRILAIDPGANLGWAVRLTPAKVMFGTEDFQQFAGVDGRTHLKFHCWLSGFLYTANPDIVVSEAPIFRGKYSEYLYGFSVIISMLCFERGIPIERAHLMSVKKNITGSGSAKKEDMIKAIRNLGYDVDTEHEADAIGVLLFKERHSSDQQDYEGKVIHIKPRVLNRLKKARKIKKS